MNSGNKCIDFHTHPIPDTFIAAMDEPGINVIEEDGFPLLPQSESTMKWLLM